MRSKSTSFLRLLCLVVIVAIFLPTVKQLNHALYEHFDVVCDNPSTLHFHQVEFDCEFQKYHPAPQIVYNRALEPMVAGLASNEIESLDYSFLNNFSKLHFSLRAPPLTS